MKRSSSSRTIESDRDILEVRLPRIFNQGVCSMFESVVREHDLEWYRGLERVWDIDESDKTAKMSEIVKQVLDRPEWKNGGVVTGFSDTINKQGWTRMVTTAKEKLDWCLEMLNNGTESELRVEGLIAMVVGSFHGFVLHGLRVSEVDDPAEDVVRNTKPIVEKVTTLWEKEDEVQFRSSMWQEMASRNLGKRSCTIYKPLQGLLTEGFLPLQKPEPYSIENMTYLVGFFGGVQLSQKGRSDPDSLSKAFGNQNKAAENGMKRKVEENGEKKDEKEQQKQKKQKTEEDSKNSSSSSSSNSVSDKQQGQQDDHKSVASSSKASKKDKKKDKKKKDKKKKKKKQKKTMDEGDDEEDEDKGSEISSLGENEQEEVDQPPKNGHGNNTKKENTAKAMQEQEKPKPKNEATVESAKKSAKPLEETPKKKTQQSSPFPSVPERIRNLLKGCIDAETIPYDNVKGSFLGMLNLRQEIYPRDANGETVYDQAPPLLKHEPGWQPHTGEWWGVRKCTLSPKKCNESESSDNEDQPQQA